MRWPANAGNGDFLMTDRIPTLFRGNTAIALRQARPRRPEGVAALAGPRLVAQNGAPAEGIGAGTPVMTLRGALPVEDMRPGDKIITRDRGVRELRAISQRDTGDQLVRIAPGALGADRPEAPVWVLQTQPVLVRDWRAQARFGKPQAIVPAARIVDGQSIIQTAPDAPLRLFTLLLDSPHIIYAGGIEMLSGALTA